MDERYLLLLGAPKAGTTSLAKWMHRHQNVFLAERKEPKFFTDFAERKWTGPGIDRFLASTNRTEDEFRANWGDEVGGAWRLDASTDYLSCDASPDLIAAWARRFETKAIIVLRDPVDRAISQYSHCLSAEMETLSLTRSMDAEEDRRKAAMHPLFYHKQRSAYSAKTTLYKDLFGDDLLILRYEDFQDQAALMEKVASFLSVEPFPKVTRERQNVRRVSKSPWLTRRLNSPTSMRIARMVTPVGMRDKIKRTVNDRLTERFQASDVERRYVREVLADEISACEANPLIDTSEWRCAARPASAQSK